MLCHLENKLLNFVLGGRPLSAVLYFNIWKPPELGSGLIKPPKSSLTFLARFSAEMWSRLVRWADVRFPPPPVPVVCSSDMDPTVLMLVVLAARWCFSPPRTTLELLLLPPEPRALEQARGLITVTGCSLIETFRGSFFRGLLVMAVAPFRSATLLQILEAFSLIPPPEEEPLVLELLWLLLLLLLLL